MEDDTKSVEKPVEKKPGKKRKGIKDIIPMTFEDLGTCTYIRDAALKKHGLTPDVWAKTLKAELEATKIKVFQTKDGDILESEPYVDHKIRQVARQDLGEYLGIKPPQQQELNIKGVKFIIED